MRLGQLEGGADDVESLALAIDDDLDDVEAKDDVRIIEQPQPCERATGDERLLVAIHRRRGRAEVAGASRFYLDEDEFVSVAADDIDFAAPRRAEVFVENFESVPPQVPGGQRLPTPPEPVTVIFRFRRARESPGAPGENFCDGVRKAHAFSDVRGAARCHILCAGRIHIRETSRHVRSSGDHA